MTSLLVASGIVGVGVVPALAAGGSPAPAAFHSDHVPDRGWGHHNRLFRDRGDFRYVWFKVCEGTATGATTTTTTAAAAAAAAGTTTDTVAPDAVAAAVEGAALDTATTTDAATPLDTVTTDTTTTETTPTETTPTETTPTETTAADGSGAKAYPTFVVVPIPKDEVKAIYKLDKRPCYDLTTGAPQVTDTTTTTTTDPTPAVATTTETTTAVPVGTVTG